MESGDQNAPTERGPNGIGHKAHIRGHPNALPLASWMEEMSKKVNLQEVMEKPDCPAARLKEENYFLFVFLNLRSKKNNCCHSHSYTAAEMDIFCLDFPTKEGGRVFS